MPDSYGGGNVQARFYWTTTGGGAAETVRWGVTGASYGDGDALDTTNVSGQTVDDTWQADYDLHITSWTGNLDVAGASGELSYFQVYRVPSADTLGVDARLIAVQIRYKQVQFGD